MDHTGAMFFTSHFDCSHPFRSAALGSVVQRERTVIFDRSTAESSVLGKFTFAGNVVISLKALIFF